MHNDIAFGSSFNIGLDFGIATREIDISGGFPEVEADLLSFAVEPSYHFGNGAYVGVYYRAGDLDLSIGALPITFGVDTRQSGIFGGYENGPLWVEAFYGMSDTSPSLGGVDITDYGLSASYDVSAEVEVFGHVARTDIDFGPGDVDLTLMAIGADYDFGNGLSLYGGVGRLDVSSPLLGTDVDASQVSLGLSYDLSNSGTGIPGIVSLEVGRTSSDLGGLASIDVDTIGIGFTIPLGPNAGRTPLNSSTQVARGNYRSAIAGSLASLR